MEQIEQNKKSLIEALEKTLGVVTTACKMVNIGRTSFYRYVNEDPDFRKQVEDIENIALDFAESKLHGLIKDSNPTAIIFYLKTKGKNRGYVERTESIVNNVPFSKEDEQEIKRYGKAATIDE